jgi:hypothetical protein
VLASAKAHAEAIGATFAIAGGANNSTLVTVTFPIRRSAPGMASAISSSLFDSRRRGLFSEKCFV